MLWAKKYECSYRFRIYKYIGDQSCGVEHAISSDRKISTKVIASFCVNLYRDGKGPNFKLLKMLEGRCDCQGNSSRDSGAQEFNDHFVEFKDKFPEAAFVLEHEVGFEK
ncbi:hypothetical protein H5410_050501 [Solanum commersonii]|uniref:Uncharacterized protein n=1 Tax=Solanum commersonii TaxID=4109 RepID=A0A9J5WVQ0_SOLCO|nr:hypothetical protein H5410_050501 [Solanum commersonii]